MRLRPILGTLRALGWAVGIGTGLAVAGLFAARALLPEGVLHGTGDAVGNYVQTLGTIYAVLLAFVVFVVWSQFNEARTHVDREANEIVDLFRLSRALPEAERAKLQTYMRDYVRAIVGREWDAMRGCDHVVIDECWKLVDRIWDVMQAYEPGTKCHETVHGELLTRFNDLSDARTLRLSSSRQRVPLALKILIYLGGVLTTVSIYLLDVRSWGLHVFMTGAVAGAISHILFIVHDLDDCFAGDWQVSIEPYQRVLDYMERTGAWSS
jgi:hypothetical protein